MFPLNAAAATTGGVVTVSPATISDIGGNGSTDRRAAYVVGIDGITYQELGTPGPVRSAINQPSDWIDPKIGSLGSYQVMATQLSGGALDIGSDVLLTWLPMSTERLWSVTETANNSTTVAQLQVDIRLGTGAIKDSDLIDLVTIKGTP